MSRRLSRKSLRISPMSAAAKSCVRASRSPSSARPMRENRAFSMRWRGGTSPSPRPLPARRATSSRSASTSPATPSSWPTRRGCGRLRTRSRRRGRAARADLKLVVFDVTRPSELAALGDVLDAATILVANKVDLATADDIAALAAEAAPLSIKTGEGMSALLDRLQAAVARRIGDGSGPALTRARHRRELEDCAAALRRALTAALPELAGEDLRLALRSLGRITGRVDVEDILDVIFRDFCIGK